MHAAAARVPAAASDAARAGAAARVPGRYIYIEREIL